MIRCTCNCGRQLQFGDDEAGQRARCPDCDAVLTVPAIVDESFQVSSRPEAGFVARENIDRTADRRRSRDYADDYEEEQARAATATSGKAVTGLVLGILSFFAPVFLSIPAIIVAALGIAEINRSRGRLSGKGMAIAGIVTGGMSIVMGPLLLIAMMVPAVHKVRDAAARAQSMNNMKQTMLAMHSYHDQNGHFPQAIFGRDGRPLLSWRVTILPFIEQDALFRQFKLDEPWDSPRNIALLPLMPMTYRHPNQPANDLSNTFYQGFVGKDTFFRSSNKKVTMPDITDGTSNTIAIVEAAGAVPWTKPEDLRYDANAPIPAIGGHSFRSCNVAMADGSVFAMDPTTISERTLRNAITINDGQVLGPDFFRR